MVHVLHQAHASVLTAVNGLVVTAVHLCVSKCVSMVGSALSLVSTTKHYRITKLYAIYTHIGVYFNVV
jgi:hypothetical protein